MTRYELQQEEASLARETARQDRRTVTAAAAGTLNYVRPASDLPGRYVKEGEVVGYVTPAAGRVARIVVPQADIGLVRDRLAAVSVRLADRRTDVASQLVRAVPAGRDDLLSTALARGAGGSVAADPRDSRGLRAFERHFQFDVALPDTGVAEFGAKVHVRLEYAWEPVGQITHRRVRQLLLTRFEA